MPEQVEETLRLGLYGRKITCLPLIVPTLVDTFHNLYRKLLREYRHYQCDDVGSGIVSIIAQTFYGAKVYASLYVVTRLCQSILSVSGIDTVPLPVRWWLDAVATVCPRMFDAKMMVDPVLQLVLEALLPFATSVLGHSICVCLVPELDLEDKLTLDGQSYIKYVAKLVADVSEEEDG